MIKLRTKYEPLWTFKTRYCYLQGGRGSGKSVAAATRIADLCIREENHRILWLRYTMASAEQSIIPEFETALEMRGVTDGYKLTKTSAEINSSEIIFAGVKTSSGNQTAKLKSIPGLTTLVYEEFEEHPDEHSFDEIDNSVRQKGVQNRIILISNALHKESWQYKRFFKEPYDTTLITTTYQDNVENLPQSYLDKIQHTKETNLEKYQRDYLGWHYEKTDGALWTYDMIEADRVKTCPDLDRVVVAIDPAVTANKTSDETGIIVAGKKGNKGYILEDASGSYKPGEWASVAVSLYDKWQADRVIGEVNNGGDLIENVIRSVRKNISYKDVRASRGKVTRAEPVVSLYEAGDISHVGHHPQLERQMTTWNHTDEKSPDRVDALVWALTDLLVLNNSDMVTVL